MKGMIHYAKLANSPRLQRVMALLSDGKPHTTKDIALNADVYAVGTAMSELRMNGIRIGCDAVKGFKGRYEYTLGKI